MPLELIRSDITLMRTDAVVNAANSRLQRGGGVCGAIFARADSEALQAACNEISFCPTGEAVITPSFGLNAPFVIHAVGPVWQGGNHNEDKLLCSAYTRALDVAHENNLHSIAFPLISSGIYGFPKQQALSIAVSAIGDWLMESSAEMQVYLVLFDQISFELGSSLHSRVRAFIDQHYVETHTFARRNACIEAEMQLSDMCAAPQSAEPLCPAAAPRAAESAKAPQKRSLEDLLKQTEESFTEMLLRLIDERGLTDPQVYKRANLDRKLFSKIRSNPDYQPGKNTVLALSVALRLNLDQTADLLRRAGFALSPSSKSDLIVEYFIREQSYDIHEINETLFAFGQKLLGCQ